MGEGAIGARKLYFRLYMALNLWSKDGLVNPYDTFSEAVIVHFNKDITLKVLIEVHLLTHSSASAHSMRDKYRSAVYYFDSMIKTL